VVLAQNPWLSSLCRRPRCARLLAGPRSLVFLSHPEPVVAASHPLRSLSSCDRAWRLPSPRRRPSLIHPPPRYPRHQADPIDPEWNCEPTRACVARRPVLDDAAPTALPAYPRLSTMRPCLSSGRPRDNQQCDSSSTADPVLRRQKKTHAKTKTAALVSILAASIPVSMAQQNCVSLRGSSTCPAFSAASINTNLTGDLYV
jgi:hypothetical protein